MSKPNLILLHGALGAKSQFTSLIPLLSSYCTVHTFDFEGHGESPLRSRPFRIEHFAENLQEYLLAHNLSGVNIFGYSMGGYVALYHAVKFPDMSSQIFTLGSKFKWDKEIAIKECQKIDPGAIEKLHPKFAERLKKRHALPGWKNVAEKTIEMLIHLGKDNIIDDLEITSINQRVRIAIGDNDNMVTRQESIDIYRRLKNGEFQIFSNTYHPLEKVDFKMLANTLIKFVR